MMWFLAMVAGSPLYLLPWTFQLLLVTNRGIKHISILYGVLCSAIMFGRYCGSNFAFDIRSGARQSATRVQCFILSLAFLLLSGSTSVFILLVCYFLIGFASSSLGAAVLGYKVYWKWRFPRGVGANMRSEVTRANLVGLIFCALLSGFTFDASPNAMLPAYVPCIIMTAYFMLLNIIDYLKEHSFFTRKKKGRPMDAIDGSSIESTLPLVSEEDEQMDLNAEPTAEYVAAFEGNVVAAKKAYAKRLQWRRKFNVDNIMSTPQNNFDTILRCYPHAIHGRSLEGCVVCYEVCYCFVDLMHSNSPTVSVTLILSLSLMSISVACVYSSSARATRKSSIHPASLQTTCCGTST